VHCQLETLRRCFPSSIRSILGELPKTLDETYERILLEIDEEKRPFAHRLLQCLVISVRPLRVEELAELFAIFPNADSTPNFNIGWRPEDPEAFVLSACSTLIAIVKVYDKKVVQFSHFSVREYLTSARIANSAYVSHFHILPKPAHTLLAEACLSVLLQLDDSIDETKIQNFPLASYAAEHWVDHARFEDVSSRIQDGVDRLFDKNKPHFAAWILLYDVDYYKGGLYDRSPRRTRPNAVPLYYAVTYGFRDLAERLLDAHPRDVNARGGYHETPLSAALSNEYPNIALLLLERGAAPEFQGRESRTVLYIASSRGYVEVVQLLVARGANLNAECNDMVTTFGDVKWTPLLVALNLGNMEIVRILLEHGADPNYQDNFGRSSLYIASRHSSNDLTRLLLDYAANPDSQDSCGETVLHQASFYGKKMDVILLLEYGANVDARSKAGWTPLHVATNEGHLEVVQLLLDHDADANAQGDHGRTPLHLAASRGYLRIVEVLLERVANPHVQDVFGDTPFQLASTWYRTHVVRLLSEGTGENIVGLSLGN
jgi:ankyrin repeat protein